MSEILNRLKENKDYVVTRQLFKDVDTSDPFFKPFRDAYGEYYEEWLRKKIGDYVYTVYDANRLVGFLKLKIEENEDDFEGISPPFGLQRRLKISSMRTLSSYPGLGSQLMHIVFDTARKYRVSEIYGTIPDDLPEKERVDRFFQRWGYRIWGKKISRGLEETVILHDSGDQSQPSSMFFIFKM